MTFYIEGNEIGVTAANLSSIPLSGRWESKNGTPRALAIGTRRDFLQVSARLTPDVSDYLQAIFNHAVDGARFDTSVWTEAGAPMAGTLVAVTGKVGISNALYLSGPTLFPETLDLSGGWCASGWYASNGAGPWSFKTEADPELTLSNGRVQLAAGYWAAVRIVAANRPSGWNVPTGWVAPPRVTLSGAILEEPGKHTAHPMGFSAEVILDNSRSATFSFELTGFDTSGL